MHDRCRVAPCFCRRCMFVAELHSADDRCRVALCYPRTRARTPTWSVEQSTCHPKSEMTSRSLNSYVSNIIALPTANKGGGSDWTRKREPRMSRSSANLLALQWQRRCWLPRHNCTYSHLTPLVAIRADNDIITFDNHRQNCQRDRPRPSCDSAGQ